MDESCAGAELDAPVSEALEQGGRIELRAAGSTSFPPAGIRATDHDCFILSSTAAWTTAVERPREGGTLLEVQRWRRGGSGQDWLLSSHRYIQWNADGATTIAALRCDGRGCVLLGREISTRDRRVAVL